MLLSCCSITLASPVEALHPLSSRIPPEPGKGPMGCQAVGLVTGRASSASSAAGRYMFRSPPVGSS